jgi:hypothetical protein
MTPAREAAKMKVIMLGLAAGLVVAVIPAVALAQGRGGGQDNPNPARVCFYSDAGFQGEVFCVNPNGRSDALSGDWNDRISSIRVGRNTDGVEVCRNANFGGGCQFLTGDASSLPNFNDQISSFQVGQRSQVAAAPSPPSPVPNQVCFFQDWDFAGSSLCRGAGESSTSLGAEWNDRISSLQVPPSLWVQVCSDFGFQGQCNSIGSNIARLETGNDTISSFRVFAR